MEFLYEYDSGHKQETNIKFWIWKWFALFFFFILFLKGVLLIITFIIYIFNEIWIIDYDYNNISLKKIQEMFI